MRKNSKFDNDISSVFEQANIKWGGQPQSMILGWCQWAKSRMFLNDGVQLPATPIPCGLRERCTPSGCLTGLFQHAYLYTKHNITNSRSISSPLLRSSGPEVCHGNSWSVWSRIWASFLAYPPPLCPEGQLCRLGRPRCTGGYVFNIRWRHRPAAISGEVNRWRRRTGDISEWGGGGGGPNSRAGQQ